MKNLADYLIKNNKVDIISYKLRWNDISVYKGIKINYVKSFPFFVYGLRNKIDAARGIKRFIYGLMLLAVRSCSLLCRIVSKDGVNRINVKKIENIIYHLISEKKYDYIVCIGVPFESFLAAYDVSKKYKNIKVIAYQVDDFVGGKEIHFPRFLLVRRDYYRKILLNHFVDSFYKYFMTEAVYHKEIHYVQNRNNVYTVGLPLLIRQTTGVRNIDVKKENIIVLSYVGSLSKGIRSPEECLKIMTEVARLKKISVDFYHRGDCANIIKEYAKHSKGAIKDHGTICASDAYAVMSNSDVLIAISVFDGDQVSGKTFDYFSTGKPVIFFYFRKDDMNLPFYEQYTLGLPVRIAESDLNDNVQKVCSFLDSCIGKKMDFEIVKKIFYKYTPDCVVNELFGGERI